LSDRDANLAAVPRPSLHAPASPLGRWLIAQGRAAIAGLIVLTLLTGVAFPAILWAIARAAFPAEAGGSLVAKGGEVVGSHLIGQAFTRPEDFHPRPSVAGAGYDARASGASNLAPDNPKLIEAIQARAIAYRRENGLSDAVTIPSEAVTASASGLDPDISPPDAALQVPRVARARGLSAAAVRALVAAHTRPRQLFILGQPRVNVLDLNVALDAATGSRRTAPR
jgi:K+-transporting ATPase ATPase C chain